MSHATTKIWGTRMDMRVKSQAACAASQYCTSSATICKIQDTKIVCLGSNVFFFGGETK